MTKSKHNRMFRTLNGQVWAIHPLKLQEIDALIQRKLSSEEEPIPGLLESRATGDSYAVKDGVAVVKVYDVIDRRMNMFMDFSGGTSTQILEKTIRRAAADPAVSAILLDVDSPGGNVHGPSEIGQVLLEVRQSKPVVAFCGELMASAAYWIGSTANEIVVTADAEVGSIGVCALHYDLSEYDKSFGVKRTWVTAGKYKRLVNDTEPLSSEGLDYLQSQLDHYYTLFIDAVAQGRGVSAETVLKDMADGRIFIGEQARKAGLVDRIGDMESALALAGQLANRKPQGGTRMSDPKTPAGEATSTGQNNLNGLTVARIETERPDLFKAIGEKAAADAKQTGIAEERKRVAQILEADGDPKVALECISEGVDVGTAAMRFFKAEKERSAMGLEDMKKSAPPTVGAVEGPEPEGEAGGDPSAALVRKANKLAAAEGIDFDAARKRVMKEDPALAKAVKETLGM